MSFTSWRGTVGVIKPTLRPGSLEEFIRLLPEGIGVVPLFQNARRGTTEEFGSVMEATEAKIRELAEAGVDLIHPEGAPPNFMVYGFKGEMEIVSRLQQEHGVPIVTGGMTHIEAMRAMGMRRIVGVTYFRGDNGDVNDVVTRYFSDAGFEVLAMEGIDVPFDRVGHISEKEFYTFAKAAFLRHEGADGIYIFGSGWRVLKIVETLEQDLGVPVIHPVPARVWAIQQRLHVRQPMTGYGRLLAEMPPLEAEDPAQFLDS